MKLTQEQAIEALRLAGVTAAEIVENEADSEYNGDTVLEMVDTAREPVVRPKHRAEYRAEVETQIAGKVGKELERDLRQTTGIVRFSDGATDKQKIKEAMDFLSANKDKNKEDAQAVINQMAEAHKAEIDTLRNELGEQLTASERKRVEKELTGYYEGVIAEMPILETANKKELAKLGRQFMESRFSVRYDEDGNKVGYYDKTNPEAPALNASKNNPLDDKEELKTYLSSLGVYKTDMRHNNPADPNAAKVPTSTPMKGDIANGRTVDAGDAWYKNAMDYAKANAGGDPGVKI